MKCMCLMPVRPTTSGDVLHCFSHSCFSSSSDIRFASHWPSHFVAKEAVKRQQHPMPRSCLHSHVKMEAKEEADSDVEEEVSTSGAEMVYVAFCPFHDPNGPAPLDKRFIGRGTPYPGSTIFLKPWVLTPICNLTFENLDSLKG